MTERPFNSGTGAGGDTGAAVVPPLEADPLFIEAVDEAIAGDPLDGFTEAQPLRPMRKAEDFSSLYVRHRSSFELHARRFLNDARDVDEVVQETFLRLFLALPEIETELQAIAFGRRTLTNLCIDRYRADKRRPRLVELDDAVLFDLEDKASFDDPILRAEDAAVVRQALALLSPLHRAALVKREIEEKPLPVIAEELGIADESVKHLLFRARRALRRLLVGTTVDPDQEMAFDEVMSVAVRRAASGASATLNSILVLVVALVAGVPMVRALHNSSPTVRPAMVKRAPVDEHDAAQPPAQEPRSVRSPRAQATAPRQRGQVSTSVAPSRHRTRRSTPQRTTASGGTATVPVPVQSSGGSTSGQPKPVNGGGGTLAASSLSGDLTALATPTVGSQHVLSGAVGQGLFSQFQATTAQGEFTLAQVINNQPGQPLSISLQPSLPVQGQTIPTIALGFSTGHAGDSGGMPHITGSIDVALQPQAVGQSALAPGTTPTHISVELVTDPTVTHVLSEHVVVTDAPTSLPTAAQSGAPVASPTPTAAVPSSGLGGANPSTTEGVVSNSAVVRRPGSEPGV